MERGSKMEDLTIVRTRPAPVTNEATVLSPPGGAKRTQRLFGQASWAQIGWRLFAFAGGFVQNAPPSARAVRRGEAGGVMTTCGISRTAPTSIHGRSASGP